MNEGELARRFWKKKWKSWHREHPEEAAASGEVMATWRNELRTAIQDLKKENPPAEAAI